MKKTLVVTSLFAVGVILIIISLFSSSSALQYQVDYFEKLHFKEGKDIFDRVEVLSTEVSEVALQSGAKKTSTVVVMGESDAAFSGGWTKENYRHTGGELTVYHNDESVKNFLNTKEVLITKNDYPFHRPGWLISGRYICIEKKENGKLHCVGAEEIHPEFDDEKQTRTAQFYEFAMWL